MRTTRRAFIIGVATCAIAAPAVAAPGTAVPAEILAHARSMRSIRTGSGRGAVFILFSTSCQFSRALYQASFAFAQNAAFNWIPVADGTPSGDTGAVILSEADARMLHAIMAGGTAPVADARHRDLADKLRGQINATIGSAITRNTGRPFGTPTLIYRDRDGISRLVRGAPQHQVLREICESAA